MTFNMIDDKRNEILEQCDSVRVSQRMHIYRMADGSVWAFWNTTAVMGLVLFKDGALVEMYLYDGISTFYYDAEEAKKSLYFDHIMKLPALWGITNVGKA